MKRGFELKGEVEIFPMANPWVYVRVPQKYTNETKHLSDRGLVAITATVGASTWKTSLMPMGDGTQFVPLPLKVRNAEDVKIGERIAVSCLLRKR